MRTVYRRPLESEIQSKVVEYARSKGVTAIKLSTQGFYGSTGYPDFLFLWEGHHPLFIEFKRPGGMVEPHQIERMERLKAKGFIVTLCASVEYGKQEIDRWLGNERLRGLHKSGKWTK